VVIVRNAIAADVDVMAAIRVDSWRATYAGLVPASILARMDVGRNGAFFARRVAETGPAETLVAEVDDEVVGYALVAPAHDEDAVGFGEVEAIYISPNLVRMGVGSVLMEAAMTRFRAAGCSAVVLWVLTDNAPARRFYEHLGYLPDGASRMLDFDGTATEEIRYRRSID
jgi:ribosomal protein S18 acetylase RimI-like enzyme